MITTKIVASGQVVKPVRMAAAVQVPENAKDLLPSIVYLHGAGNRGEALNQMLTESVYNLCPAEYDQKFVFITPENNSGDLWRPDDLVYLLDEICKQYPVDPNRICLMGHSAGARGVWATACEYPNKFCSLVPFAGYSLYLIAHKIRHVSTWAFHSKNDNIVPVIETYKMIDAMSDKNTPWIRKTIFEDGGHSTYMTYILRNVNIYRWIISQEKR